MKAKQLDLTKGSVSGQLVRFAFPLLLANLLQSLYGIVDMVVVGRFVGSAGLSAISSCSQISFILTSVCTGITMGATVLIAQYKGAGDTRAQTETTATLLSISLVTAGLLTLISLLVYQPVLELLNVPDQAMRHARDYMVVICSGTIFVFGYNAVCSIARGLGDSKSPLYFVLIATIVNVVLDLILVGSCGMGTMGAAFATILSQGVSCLLAVLNLRHRDFPFDFKWRSFTVCPEKLKIIIKIGLPSAIQLSVVNCSYLLVSGMLNVYGVTVSAASGVGLKVATFAAMPGWAIGSAVTTMAGQNMGSGNTRRAAQAMKTGLAIGVVSAAVTSLTAQLFAGQIISFFSANPEVIAEGIRYLRICCSWNGLVYAVMYLFDSFATGIGDSTLAMINACLDSILVRLLLCWLFGSVLGFGAFGIYWGQALSPVLPAIVGLVYFRSSRWKKRELIGKHH